MRAGVSVKTNHYKGTDYSYPQLQCQLDEGEVRHLRKHSAERTVWVSLANGRLRLYAEPPLAGDARPLSLYRSQGRWHLGVRANGSLKGRPARRRGLTAVARAHRSQRTLTAELPRGWCR